MSREIAPAKVAGQSLVIDGFNLLTTIEVALAGGVILAARDGCYRDIASIHGTYRRVEETRPAILAVGQTLSGLAPAQCAWYFDSPVGNSGRVKAIVLDIAREMSWLWLVELVRDPDAILIQSDSIVVTADSAILDRCGRWLNLVREVVSRKVPAANLVEMSLPEP
jgi:hypothetical protein